MIFKNGYHSLDEFLQKIAEQGAEGLDSDQHQQWTKYLATKPPWRQAF